MVLLFQFTPLREGRLYQGDQDGQYNDFNSRPCVRGDAFTSSLKLLILFQFTPLREGRLAGRDRNIHRDIFQFTPLREGRRLSLEGLPVLDISIHAPA